MNIHNNYLSRITPVKRRGWVIGASSAFDVSVERESDSHDDRPNVYVGEQGYLHPKTVQFAKQGRFVTATYKSESEYNKGVTAWAHLGWYVYAR